MKKKKIIITMRYAFFQPTRKNLFFFENATLLTPLTLSATSMPAWDWSKC